MTKEKFRNVSSLCVLFTFFAVILVGCGSGGPSTFYVLRSMEESRQDLSTPPDNKNLSILVGPVTLPGYVDRNQLITFTGKNEITLDEFNRWAESLQDSFYRVLLENLSWLLKTPEVYRYDQDSSNSGWNYQVFVDITRFDCTPGKDAVLTAFWTVVGKDGSTAVPRRKSIFRAPASVSGFPGLVEAQNQTLTAFSREIAAAIQSLRH